MAAPPVVNPYCVRTYVDCGALIPHTHNEFGTLPHFAALEHGRAAVALWVTIFKLALAIGAGPLPSLLGRFPKRDGAWLVI